MPRKETAVKPVTCSVSREVSNAVKRAAYEEGLPVNRWFRNAIASALAATAHDTATPTLAPRLSPAPAAPRQERYSRQLVRDREAEQSARLPVGKPAARPAEGDRRPMFSEARK